MDLDKITIELTGFLEERNRIFPQRKAENDEAVQQSLSEFAEQVSKIQGSEIFVPDQELCDRIADVSECPVFLCGYMKCGTTLLLELLDGHPELIVLPGDSYFVDRIVEDDTPQESALQSTWIGWVKRMVNPTGQSPFWIFGKKQKYYIRFYQYLQYWHHQLPNTWRSSVLSVVLAYYCANPAKSSHPRKWVEKTPGNEFRRDKILKHFPNAYFIHIVRDPRENLASLKKLYATRNWQWNPVDMAGKLSESCRLAGENQRRVGKERYHILRYEDLTEDSAARMKEVASFLGIHWNESLQHPTVNSQPAHANSMYKDRQITGVVRKATGNKWQNVLTKMEQRLASGTLRNAKKVGYFWEISMIDSIILLLINNWVRLKKILVERR